MFVKLTLPPQHCASSIKLGVIQLFPINLAHNLCGPLCCDRIALRFLRLWNSPHPLCLSRSAQLGHDCKDVSRRCLYSRIVAVEFPHGVDDLLFRPVLQFVAPPRENSGFYLGTLVTAPVICGDEKYLTLKSYRGSVILPPLRRKRSAVPWRRSCHWSQLWHGQFAELRCRS